jgi:hypothetical protein
MSDLPEPRLVELCAADHVLTLDDLWLRCFALGTTHTPTQLSSLLRGERLPSRHEYNVVAVAMNEYLSDIGAAQSVPYIEQLEPSDHPALPHVASLGQSGGLSDEATRACTTWKRVQGTRRSRSRRWRARSLGWRVSIHYPVERSSSEAHA